MSQLLKQALHASAITSDIIYAMHAKLTQRILKLGISDVEPWFFQVQQTMSIAQVCLESRWKTVMRNSSPKLDLSGLQTFNTTGDILHQLPELENYCAELQHFISGETLQKFEPVGKLSEFHPDHLPELSCAVRTKNNQQNLT